MDHQTFDRLTRLFSAPESRREALRVVLGSLLGGAVLGQSVDALAGRKNRKPRGDSNKRRRRGAEKSRGNESKKDDKKDDRQQGDRQSSGGKDEGNRGDRLAHEGKKSKRRKGKGKGKDNGKDKKDCAKAGQPPKRDRRCCNGLVRDDSGRCAEPLPPPSPQPDTCAGGNCSDPSQSCASTCSGCCVGEECRPDTGGDVCSPPGSPCEQCECGLAECGDACCERGEICCANTCVTGVCCVPGDCASQTCENKTCTNNQCVYTPITNSSDPSCGTICCNGACCAGGVEQCTPSGECGQCQTAANCPRPPDCKVATCVSGVCGDTGASDGTTCPGGVCCAAACQAGDNCCTNAQCGAGSNGPFCQNGRCVQCRTGADCTAPVGGSVTCSAQGFCNRTCNNTLHRICGSNPSVCQECCNNHSQCRSIDEASTCVGGQCRCPAGFTRCGMECIDTRIEPNHCGSCAGVCESGTCNNGECTVESCGGFCNPQHQNCDEGDICLGDKTCVPVFNGTCRCPSGTVACNDNGSCDSCGRCGVSCPPDPQTGSPGFCCPGGFCSCGGSCGTGCDECWLTPSGQDQEGNPTGYREQCDTGSGCVDCWGQCCTACINGECASSGPFGGSSVRRR